MGIGVHVLFAFFIRFGKSDRLDYAFFRCREITAPTKQMVVIIKWYEYAQSSEGKHGIEILVEPCLLYTSPLTMWMFISWQFRQIALLQLIYR